MNIDIYNRLVFLIQNKIIDIDIKDEDNLLKVVNNSNDENFKDLIRVIYDLK